MKVSGISAVRETVGATAMVDPVDVKVTIPGSNRSDLPTYQNQVIFSAKLLIL